MRARIQVLVQIAAMLLVCWLAVRFGPAYAPLPAASDLAARLAFAVQWCMVPAFALLAMIWVTMNTRFLTDAAIDGTRTPASRFMEINLRATQNTLEQAVLAAFAWIGLAVALPPEQLGLIPVLAVLFGLGRVLFWVGYQLHPMARASGFCLSIVPNTFAIVWLFGRALSGSFVAA